MDDQDEYKKSSFPEDPNFDEEMDSRIAKLVQRKYQEPEKRRRALELASTLIKADDNELRDYAEKYDGEGAGLAESILYKRGSLESEIENDTEIKKFKNIYGGAFLEFDEEREEKLVFDGPRSGWNALFKKDAEKDVEFRGNEAGYKSELRDNSVKSAKFTGKSSGAYAKLIGDSYKKAEFLGEYSGYGLIREE